MLKEAYLYLKEAGFFEDLLKKGAVIQLAKKAPKVVAEVGKKSGKVKKFSMRWKRGKGLVTTERT
jgi:hypothetical protein